MPTIDENRIKWGVDYTWPKDGSEWSGAWGGPEMQWYWTILPRIRRYLPAQTVVEIAPGYGRWTHFLLMNADRLIAVDISQRCIDVCRKRFSDSPNALFFINDGRSLACVGDGMADFVFSFDSLVHAESDAIEGYLRELARKLSKDGVAFIHHSNLGEYPWQAKLSGIPKLRVALRLLRLLENRIHWRAKSMTALLMVELAEQFGLQCISQEMVNWGTRRALIDCFSTLARQDSKWARQNRVLRNGRFMDEAEAIRRLSSVYGS